MYRIYGIIIPNSFPTWKATVTQNQYVARFKREIEKILANVDSKELSCYTDVYLEYIKTSHSPDTLRDKRTIIGAIEQFEVHGSTRMEGAGMNFSKEVLIPYYHRN